MYVQRRCSRTSYRRHNSASGALESTWAGWGWDWGPRALDAGDHPQRVNPGARANSGGRSDPFALFHITGTSQCPGERVIVLHGPQRVGAELAASAR